MNKEGIPLSAEDRHRMTRLFEEVQGRLEEMALITARTLKIPVPNGMRPEFRPHRPEGEAVASSEFRWGIVCAQQADGRDVCGCYDSVQGLCYYC